MITKHVFEIYIYILIIKIFTVTFVFNVFKKYFSLIKLSFNVFKQICDTSVNIS